MSEHRGYNWQLAQELEEAFMLIGTSMMSGEWACKLLAFTYVLGGEITVLHEGLNASIAIAAQKLNLKGGEIPKGEFLPTLRRYIAEMEATREQTPWLQEIYDRYQINQTVKTTKDGRKDTAEPGVQGELKFDAEGSKE